MARILVVDDDPQIVRLVRSYLEQDGFSVLTAADGDAALHLLRVEHPDLMVLDLMLPKRDGLEVTRIVRADPALAATPILMLTARVEEIDRIVGLELGADDYVTKPFNPREITARVKAILRRAHAADAPSPAAPPLSLHGITLDPTAHSVTRAGEFLTLTRSEFDVLYLLMAAPGRAFSRGQILADALGEESESLERTVDSHIKNLRRKVEVDPRRPVLIETVFGVGYRFAPLTRWRRLTRVTTRSGGKAMNLFGKVMLALFLAVAVALATTGIFASRGARQAAQGYSQEIIRQQAAPLAAEASALRAAGASWDDIQQWVDDALPGPGMMQGGMGRMGPNAGRGRQAMMGRNRVYSLVAPESGAPLAQDGTQAGAQARALGIPVTVAGETVALLTPLLEPSGMTAAGEAFVGEVNQALLLAALAAGLVALAAGALVAASILRPLQRVEQTVARIAQGDLTARVQYQSRDEVGRLAAGVNTMAASLEEQEQLRQRLVADIAHELRTPLSVVQGNLQALLDGVYPLNREEVQTIFDETRLLTRIVSDLHDVAQAEAHRLRLSAETLAAAAVLSGLADRFRPVAEQQGVDLRVDAPTTLSLSADPERLQQVLHNLVGNALRHSPPGGTIWLSAGIAPAPGAFVRLTVRDSGPGIAPDDVPHIFDRFYRAEKDRTRDPATTDLTAGAGLGLAIARALVEAQGGRISVESAPGMGASFHVDLPSA